MAASRADAVLVERGLAASRTLAQRLIAAGSVRRASAGIERLVARPSELVASHERLLVDRADPLLRYVSRGGLKLEGALARLSALVSGAAPDVALAGAVALDVGLSTGGFADCLLRRGVARVVGVDVGHGQLHPSLQGDPRLHAFEGLNARELDRACLGDAMPTRGFDLATVDVSFIGLAAVLPAVVPLLRAQAWLIALVKPQFELGPQARDRAGVVVAIDEYAPLLERLQGLCRSLGLLVMDQFESPLRGGDGNREFFLIARAPEGARVQDPLAQEASGDTSKF